MTEGKTLIRQLRELKSAIEGYDDPRRASDEWKKVYKLLKTTPLPPGRVSGVVGMRNVPGLGELIDQLQAPEPAAGTAPDPETCKRALHAFRKRARLTRLDDESKLGRSPLTKGADKSLGAIQPPSEYPAEVWQQLVREGKLRYLGHGLYELAKASDG